MIACVLKSGVWKNRLMKIEYSARHVQWLQKMVSNFCGSNQEFVCLTDIKIDGVNTIPLRDNLPGWWSKIELFREFEECFYIDDIEVNVKAAESTGIKGYCTYASDNIAEELHNYIGSKSPEA